MSTTPCTQSPEDWFIERDGRQYPDDPLLTADEEKRVRLSVAPLAGESEADHEARMADALAAARANRRRQQLTRRRQAREACYGCPVRLHCLDARLEAPALTAGTWGGYYREEIAQIIALRDRRSPLNEE